MGRHTLTYNSIDVNNKSLHYMSDSGIIPLLIHTVFIDTINDSAVGKGKSATAHLPANMNDIIPIGTETEAGEIVAIGHFEERCYWIKSDQGVISMFPQATVEKITLTKDDLRKK